MYISLQNMNYLPKFPRTTEICNQNVSKIAPASRRLNCSQWQNSHLSNGCNQKLPVGADGRNAVFQPVWVVQSPCHQLWNTPNNVIPSIGNRMMTVDQTANWIRGLCLQWGWQQTEEYAMSFRENDIDGSMLMHLNHELLRFDMGISNHLHRYYLLTVIRWFFPRLNLNRGFTEPLRLSDFCNLDINHGDGVKIATTRMQGSPSANEKPCFLKHPVSEKDDFTGMDSNSPKYSSLKSMSRNSDSNMAFSEGKSQRSPTRKPLSQIVKLESEGISTNSSLRHKCSVEKAAPWSKSFEDAYELRLGKSRDANDSFAVQKESTPARELPSKLILTHSSLNFEGIENIRCKFMKFNFGVTIEQVSHYCCVLTFKSRVEAMTALCHQHQIGFNLDPYVEDRCRTRMSPVVNQSFSHDASSSEKSLNRNVKNTSEGVVNTCMNAKPKSLMRVNYAMNCLA